MMIFKDDEDDNYYDDDDDYIFKPLTHTLTRLRLYLLVFRLYLQIFFLLMSIEKIEKGIR